ncbi:hypothetical protein L596_023630 [Steinernema carpocapsae]|uniref:Saposin B-type domain-containing protein n=1 Tax=Steinernema carpocapsae TaxID=34508 RepID=A0A4U5ME94_STECR|nr:hypothetical protein L596_023630 [Steinernema carpocapsae]
MKLLLGNGRNANSTIKNSYCSRHRSPLLLLGHPGHRSRPAPPQLQVQSLPLPGQGHLGGENLSGDALKHFLDKKCDILGPLRHECKKLIDEVVKHVEKYGHKLDENELCKKLIHAC